MNNEQNELAQVALVSEQAPTGLSEGLEDRHDPKAYVGFKAPVPWDGWTDEERRAAFGGFLYPSWYPFAVCEGNYTSSMFADLLGFRSAKVQGVVDESIEERKKQFSIPMQSKKTYTAHSPVGTLKRK